MICAGTNSPASVQSWLTSNGVTTVTALVNGGSAYGQYGNNYVPYNVFLDSDFIVRFTAAGYSQSYYNQWVTLAEEYAVAWDYPVYQDLSYNLTYDDNGDGFANPGETCELEITVSNYHPCPTGTGVTGTVATTDPDITVINGTLNFPDIEGGTTGTSTNTFVFEIAPDSELHNVSFQVEMDSDGLPETQLFNFQLPLEAPCDPPEIAIEYTILEMFAYTTLFISGGTGDSYIVEKSDNPYTGFELLGIVPNSPADVDTWVDMEDGSWFYRVRSDCE
jgi:hypothetical protein